MNEIRVTLRTVFEPGQRVHVLNEGPATVVYDSGLETRNGRVYDLGVKVQVYPQSMIREFAHVRCMPLHDGDDYGE